MGFAIFLCRCILPLLLPQDGQLALILHITAQHSTSSQITTQAAGNRHIITSNRQGLTKNFRNLTADSNLPEHSVKSNLPQQLW
jgi:hypothetical protein